MSKYSKNILVTGGGGFIGSNFLVYMVNKYDNIRFINIDKLTYCSNLQYLKNIDNKSNYKFIKSNINNHELVLHILNEYNIDTVVHFAAQSHVDNSFRESIKYTKDNVLGTHSLIETCKIYGNIKKFVHVSTDEVYGESVDDIRKNENSLLQPTNPYAATKAAAEHIVQSYYRSFNFPIIITRGNNVYGRFQYPEKIIPKFITLINNGKKCTIHGDGCNKRTYIYISDVVNAFELIIFKGIIGEIYNIGSENEFSNLHIAKKIINYIKPNVDYNNFIEYVKDRDFNDKRYHIDSIKLKELGWIEKKEFSIGLKETIQWYLNIGLKNHY